MCGFLAQIGPERDPLPPAISERLAATLSHRGKDDFQTLSVSAGRIWSWRLAITDRLANRQPLRSTDDRVTVLLNGEIYNHSALRSRLKQEGVSFRTEGDTEVVLEVYQRWGLSGFESLEGMFAVCVLDERRQSLVLARDPLGIKPIYFSRDGGSMWVASEPKAILAARTASPELDRNSLNSYLLFQTVPGTRTLFRSVQKVPPGAVMEFNLKTREQTSVRSILPEPVPAPKDYEEAKELTRETLLEAAQQTFDTDLPLAFHLSGGLDSNLLVSLFRHLHPGREILCLSSLIDGESDAEWAHIQRFAGLHGCRLEKATVDAAAFFDSLDEAIYYLDEPAGDPGVIPQFHVNKLCSPHGKIVLTGHGLDEMFFGYIRNLAAAVLEERGIAALDSKSPEFARLPSDTKAFFAGWEGYLRSMASPEDAEPARCYFKKLCRVEPFTPDLHRLARETYESLAAQAQTLGEFMFAAETQIQLPALLQMEDRASMRYTVEARVPFCNPAVAALARGIPLAWKLHGGAPKGLVRDAFADLLPAPVISRKEKVGRPVPLSRWLEEPAGEPFRQGLEEKRDLFRDLTSCDLLQKAVGTSGGPDRLLWSLLSLSRWIDLYEVST